MNSNWIITLVGDATCCQNCIAKLVSYGFIRIPVGYTADTTDDYLFLRSFVALNRGLNVVMDGFDVDKLDHNVVDGTLRFINIVFDPFDGNEYKFRNSYKCHIVVIENLDRSFDDIWSDITQEMSKVK